MIPSLDPRRGGPTVAARAMSRALVAAGAEVVQVATAPRGAPEANGTPRVEDGVTYRYFARSPGLPGGFHYSRPLAQFLDREAARFDVMHVEALFQYPTIVACRAARRAGVPYVLGPLGSLNPWSLRHRAWKKKPFYWLFDRHHLAAAAALHVNSEPEAAALTALGFGDRVHLIPLGVDMPAVSPRPRTGDRSLHVLFLSRLHAVKGLPLLLEAVAARRRAGADVRLTIAGAPAPGDEAYARTLERLVESMQLAEAVRLVGHVAGEAKDALLRDADVFALTSHQESFGIAVADAMAYGLPVLITDRVGIEREVREAAAGCVVPPDARAIEGALIELSDPATRARMGARGAQLVRERYSWDETGRRLLALYEEIAGVRRDARRDAPAFAR